MKRGIKIIQGMAKAGAIKINKNVRSSGAVEVPIVSNISNLVSTNGISKARLLTARVIEPISGGNVNLVKKWHDLHQQEIVKNFAKSGADFESTYESKIKAKNTAKIKREENIKKFNYRADKKPDQTVCGLNKVPPRVQESYQPEKYNKAKSRSVDFNMPQSVNKEMMGSLRKINSDSSIPELLNTKTKMESSARLKKVKSAIPLTACTLRYRYGHFCHYCTTMSKVQLKTPRQQSEFKAATNPGNFEFSEKVF